jgi:hypothetical protein
MTEDGYKRVQWPGDAFAAKGDDLARPIRNLLEHLRLLEEEKPGDVSFLGGTPASLQVITAGATSMSKWSAGIVTALGGSTVLIAGIKGLPGDADSMQRNVFLAALAVLLSAIVLAIAVMVRADLSARALASAAQYEARSMVAKTLLENLQYAAPAQPATSGGTCDMCYVVKKKCDDKWYPVKTFAWEDDGTIAVVTDKDSKILSKDIEALVTLAG